MVAHLDGDRIVCFVDADADGTFNPTDAAPYRAADWIVSQAELSSDKLSFEDPERNAGNASLGGFETPWGDDELRGAVFQSNGSVVEDGAFRIADVRDNFLEVRVAPAASGRVEIRKWQEGQVDPDADPDEELDWWVSFGDPADPDHQPWKWN